MSATTTAATLPNLSPQPTRAELRRGDTAASGALGRPATKALIGRHSKDRLVSVFLEERKLTSEEATQAGQRSWPPLSGLVTADPVGAKSILADHYEPYAEVQCLLLYRTALGAVMHKIVYTKTQRLTQLATGAGSVEGTQPGRQRYPFSFNFANENLPPSFCLDPNDTHDGLPIGLHWDIVAYLGRQVVVAGDSMAALSMDGSGVMTDQASCSIQRHSPVSLNFVVEHRHNPSALALPPLNASQTLRPALFSFNRSAQPETTLDASIETPLCSAETPLKVGVQLTKMLKSHKVLRVRLTAKQIITIRLSAQQQLQYKAKVAFLEDNPAPRYDPANNDQFFGIYSLNIGSGIPDRPKKGKIPARLLSLDWNKTPKTMTPLAATEFVASSPPAQSADDGSVVEVKYVLKVDVTLADSTGTFGSRERELNVSLPFLLTGDQKDETPATSSAYGSQQLRRDSSSSDTTPTAPDALLPLLAETLDDLELSIADVAVLRKEWRGLRSGSSNCVESSDHAREVLQILDTLEAQLKVFAESFAVRDGAVRWPKNPVPFNMMVLETELLARAAPNELAMSTAESTSAPLPPVPSSPLLRAPSAVDVVLACTDAFFAAGKNVVLGWIASRGSTHDDRESQEFRDRLAVLETAAGDLRRGLEAIVAGEDRERGGVVRDDDDMFKEKEGEKELQQQQEPDEQQQPRPAE
ncbi:hypothetical protein DFJ77DRAFT_170993 [Powellomyces hirtus]|nr:hypothetical protein DFJ77DRAFT_170993 [Powellomyces hirtus]